MRLICLFEGFNLIKKERFVFLLGISIVLILGPVKGNSQSLEIEYEKTIQSISDSVIQRVIEMYNSPDNINENGIGAVIIKPFPIDTIEKRNQGLDRFSIDVETYEADVLCAACILKNGILFIKIGEIFGKEFISHINKENQFYTTFKMWYKNDKILKFNLDDEVTDNLSIPLETASITISKSKNIKAGDTLFGKAHIVSEPFYKWYNVDRWIKLRYDYQYVFKCKVVEK